MRVLRPANAALCLLFASALVACSSSDEAPYDAGELPDSFYEGSDAGDTDAGAPSTGVDSGDATVSTEGDAATGDGTTPQRPDGGEDAGRPALEAGADAGPAAEAGEGDASESADAGDAAREDAGDASISSAGDASIPDAGPAALDAPDDATATSDAPSSDAAVDASPSSDDGGAMDGGEDAGFDAASLCATFDPASNPMVGVAAFDGATLIVADSVAQGYVSGSGSAGDADAVSIRAWTAPVGVMTDVHVVFTTNGFQSTTDVPLVSTGPTDAGPSGYGEGWGGTVPAAGPGAQVIWYVYGHDACTSGSQYFSNNGSNYEYTTP
jgi:hypothetical protein